jgi:hypothetical protein
VPRPSSPQVSFLLRGTSGVHTLQAFCYLLPPDRWIASRRLSRLFLKQSATEFVDVKSLSFVFCRAATLPSSFARANAAYYASQLTKSRSWGLRLAQIDQPRQHGSNAVFLLHSVLYKARYKQNNQQNTLFVGAHKQTFTRTLFQKRSLAQIEPAGQTLSISIRFIPTRPTRHELSAKQLTNYSRVARMLQLNALTFPLNRKTKMETRLC